uniref:Uncharacterized protein n=1 Tax=Siphoviridae sp. ctLKg7 TaxID=2825452 RepID=A0A8S5UVQ1_9CAUD|nr:MAG TPA: hypothetical protein [Siphoviridae sp. ctLKg7]
MLTGGGGAAVGALAAREGAREALWRPNGGVTVGARLPGVVKGAQIGLHGLGVNCPGFPES